MPDTFIDHYLEHTRIKLRGENPLYIRIDKDDYDRLKKHKWYLTGRNLGSIKTYIDGVSKSIGNFIMRDAPEGYTWDHIDRNIFNNSKANFRLATRRQNSLNGEKPIGPSGFRGVFYDERRGRYDAKIRLKTKRKHLGSFFTAEKAARAYDEAARRFHKEFAVLNFPNDIS